MLTISQDPSKTAQFKLSPHCNGCLLFQIALSATVIASFNLSHVRGLRQGPQGHLAKVLASWMYTGTPLSDRKKSECILCQAVSHPVSNSTCNLSMERPALVQTHLLFSVIHQIVYCYLFPPTDCSQTFLWDRICFLKGGFRDLTKQHEQQKISRNNGFTS